MGNFSKEPLDTLVNNLNKGYVGLHVEQGVPVLDRDLNLLTDLISATVRAVISRYIGNGIAAGSEGFIISAVPADNDFRILAGPAGPGACLVGGMEVTIEADLNYSDQAGLPGLTTPDNTQPDPRQDIVYLDVWLAEVDGGADADLLNGDDVGVQTSVRLRPEWQVRVAEGVPVPDPAPGHTHYPLAQLTRPRNEAEVQAGMITDLRQTRLTLAEVERRLNFLEQTYLVPSFAPSPGQFSPKVGGAGQNVTLFGSNFNIGTPQVMFNTVEAVIVGTPTPSQIVTTVPAGLAGPVQITVITGGGSVVSDDLFTVLAAPPAGNPPEFDPSPNQFSPKVGSANQAVTLSGSNFDGPNLQVEFGGFSATVDSVTATQIVARVPAGPAGPVQITVTTDHGSVTSDDNFTVL